MGNRAQRNVLRPLTLASLYLFCPKLSDAAEDYSAWPYGADLILNTSANGANIPITVTGFPMLVRLSAANFPFDQAQANGRDVRFAKPNGVPLDYEIERWDAVVRLAEVWVKVDTIKGNDAGQKVRMLWGNSAAADSSDPGAVFGAANGYVGAWHLNGSGASNRPNAVAGGQPAVPMQYDGDENATGIIAGADSLDGGAVGDHLDIGDGYADFSGGLTYTVWVYPTAVRKWCHILDLGNGENVDNIILNRMDTTAGLGYHNWNGTTGSDKTAPNQWTLNQWQQFGLTVSGKDFKLYKNGALVLSDTISTTMAVVNRTLNFLGKSNWAVDQYYQGKLDEPELSRVAHNDVWMRLLYQNQKSGQALPTVVKTVQCAQKFAIPADTSVAEGGQVTLNVTLDCSTGFSWSVISGPFARILDPEVKSLVVSAPRVAGDTVVVFRLTATFSDSTLQKDIRVRIKEAIPEPVFSMPLVTAWSGKDTLPYRPVISNLAAIRATRDSVIRWAWSMTGTEVDTGWLKDGVMLKSGAEGELNLKLCLDNNGPPVCRTSTLNISLATGLQGETAMVPDRSGAGASGNSGRDAKGRARSVTSGSAMPGPLFPRK
ncbi:MAG: DUF2341 domain-containing protein [Fibrobacterota bacterium]|nr:DUF2341 domain-containing protein [Fibrobacterota bacterium]